jgi:hypothetical protein
MLEVRPATKRRCSQEKDRQEPNAETAYEHRFKIAGAE